MSNRYLVVSDPHGCYEELVELFDKLKPTSNDIIISLQDLIDKGPDSPAVVRYMYNLSKKVPMVLVQANHEAKFKRFRKHLNNDKEKVAMSMKNSLELKALNDALSNNEKEFLDSAVPYFQTADLKYTFVHAGIPPIVKTLPEATTVAKAKASNIKNSEFLYFTRFVNKDGFPISLGKETGTDKYWAEVYDGRFGTVIFGHQPYFQSESAKKFNFAYGIDLGCVYGNKLAGGIIEDGDISFITVNAKQKYAQPMYTEE